jgi:hypothetical protein
MLGDIVEKMGIDFVEYCHLLEDGYEVKVPVRN